MTISNERIERAAVAMCKADGNEPDEETYWHNGECLEPWGPKWMHYRDRAHAALEADAPEIAGVEQDAARWRALVTSFGPEADVSTPHRPHTMLLSIDTEGCEVREDGRLDFKETLERALDDEIERQRSADAAIQKVKAP